MDSAKERDLTRRKQHFKEQRRIKRRATSKAKTTGDGPGAEEREHPEEGSAPDSPEAVRSPGVLRASGSPPLRPASLWPCKRMLLREANGELSLHAHRSRKQRKQGHLWTDFHEGHKGKDLDWHRLPWSIRPNIISNAPTPIGEPRAEWVAEVAKLRSYKELYISLNGKGIDDITKAVVESGSLELQAAAGEAIDLARQPDPVVLSFEHYTPLAQRILSAGYVFAVNGEGKPNIAEPAAFKRQ